MTETLSPIVERMASRIEAIADIGRVLRFNPFARDDVSDLIVGPTGDAEKVLRAWWIQGPTMTAAWAPGTSPPWVLRTYGWEIHGIEGVAPAWDGDLRDPGEDLQTLRDNTAAVCDALDTDTLDMGGLVFKAEACQISDEPAHAVFGEAGSMFAVGYVVITKTVKTMPART
jgi:hypothetical protein